VVLLYSVRILILFTKITAGCFPECTSKLKDIDKKSIEIEVKGTLEGFARIKID